MLEQTRHLSYSMGDGDFGKLKTLNKLEQLRTLLPINIQWCHCPLSKRVLHDILPRLTSLRALSLSHYKNEELPNDLFIKLKHLRFLDLSWTNIEKLPDSICLLYNLETLLLSHCFYLKELPLPMEKLINLRHLDISDADFLKMPLHLSKLKSLDVLVGATFLLSGRSGSRMEDMGELHNLYGSLSILGLQHVVDRRESLKANMREKKHVERLSLEWSGSNADNSQTERDILDELQPNTNIKEVEINGYRGTKFPNWLADHSFHKLTKVSLRYCKDCDSLPALGQLPCLKILTIRGMHQITEVTEEFYGSSSFTKPFNSLEKLEFGEMPEWKQWHVLGKGEFPVLEELSIEDCPKLIGKLPENLSSLTTLRISKCPELSLETPIQLSNLKEFEVANSPKAGVVFDDAQLFTSQLDITDCKSLTSLPISILPSTLKRIRISGCRELKLEAPINAICLKESSLVGCDSPEFLIIYSLSVRSCNNLTRLLIPTATETVCIRDCDNLEILSVACGTQMTSLHIYNCEKLKSLPEHMQQLLPSLKELKLVNCSQIESFPEGGLPFSLQVLWISDCKKLVNGRKEWHLQRLPYLRDLTIDHDGSDLAGEKWELPCSIRRLSMGNLKILSSQLLKSLTSLEYLFASELPQIQSLLEEGLPSSLSELILFSNHDLHSLPTEGLQRLMWLRCLEIWDCPNLQSLPESGMPTSISKLNICKCPLLKPLLEFNKGDYWPKIAHIPTIYIDGEYQ